MNKIQSNFKFRMSYLLTWLSWNLAIYLTLIFVVFYALIQTNIIGTSSGSLVYRIWGLVIFQLIISGRFREDFDMFLTFSNTRKEIFYSLSSVIVVNSAIISAIIVLEKIVIDFLNGQLGYNNIIDPFHFFAPYATNNVVLIFIFFLTLSIASSFLGLLLGSLYYRYGKLFTIVFWAIIFLLSIIYLPLQMWSFYQDDRLSDTFSAMGSFLGGFNVLAISGYLLLIAVALGAATFLNLRRLPQK